jgi:hypothetical protein
VPTLPSFTHFGMTFQCYFVLKNEISLFVPGSHAWSAVVMAVADLLSATDSQGFDQRQQGDGKPCRPDQCTIAC